MSFGHFVEVMWDINVFFSNNLSWASMPLQLVNTVRLFHFLFYNWLTMGIPWHTWCFGTWQHSCADHALFFNTWGVFRYMHRTTGAQETNIYRFLSHDPYQLHLFDSSTLQLFGQMLQTKLYPWLGFYLEMEMFLRTQDPAKSLLLYCWLHLSPKFHIKLTYLKSHLLEPSSFLFL